MNNIKDLCNEIKKIVATNKNDLYSSNLYWSQKAFNICDLLIDKLSNEEDIILDPFMGSGVSIIEAVKMNRKGIGCDINKLPIFLVETLLDNYKFDELKIRIDKFFLEFISKNKEKYFTTCDICNENAVITKVIFDRVERKSIPNIKKIEYNCRCSNKKLSKIPSIQDIENCLNYSFNFKINLIENSKVAVKENEDLSILFTPRNYTVINNYIECLDTIDDTNLKNALKYILVSSMHLLKITDLKSSSQWPLWTPNKDCVEKNVLDVLTKRKKLFFKALTFRQSFFKENIVKTSTFKNLKNDGDYLILNDGAQNIGTHLPKESIDLIITDPPYLDQVLYSEYSQLYKLIPGMEINFKDEIVISNGKGRGKTEELYYHLLEIAFKESILSLKTNKYFCLYFHDSSFKVWNKLISILEKNNLNFVGMCHISKSKNTLKKNLDPQKSLNGDALLFFKKVKPKNTITHQNLELFEPNISEIEINIKEKIKELIINSDLKSLTTSQIYDDGVLEYLIHTKGLNQISKHYKDLIPILKKYFNWNPDKGVWENLD